MQISKSINNLGKSKGEIKKPLELNLKKQIIDYVV